MAFTFEEITKADVMTAARTELEKQKAEMLEAFPKMNVEFVLRKDLKNGYKNFGAKESGTWVALAKTVLKSNEGKTTRYVEQISAVEGKQAGGALTGFILRRAEVEGCGSVTLTAANTKLYPIYEALGFDHEKDNPHFKLSMEDLGLDAYIRDMQSGGKGNKCWGLSGDTYVRLPANVRNLIKAMAADPEKSMVGV